MVMLVESQSAPSAGTNMSRDRHGVCHVSGLTPPPTAGCAPNLSHHQWDINDSNLPVPETFDPFQPWPHGHCRHVYNAQQEDGRRHVSGWAMRNTNNHNALILKKSCLGVLLCSQDCLLENGHKVHLRPAICDKARRKQIGKPCPNSKCSGVLELLPCRGHCGYPVTHFWRHAHGAIYFQAKGYHDHPRPEMKSVAESRRGLAGARHYKSYMVSDAFPDRKRTMDREPEDIPARKLKATVPGEEVLCSCPPFECTCNKSRQPYSPFLSPYDTPKDPSLPPPPPVTHINITNTYPLPSDRPYLDLSLRGSSTSSLPPRQDYSNSPRVFSPVNTTGRMNTSPVNLTLPSAGSETSSAFQVPSSCRQRVPGFLDAPTCTSTCPDVGERARAPSPPPPALLTRRQDLSPKFLGLHQGVESREDRLPGSSFLSPCTEALFRGPSRIEELCSMSAVKAEPRDTQASFCMERAPFISEGGSSSADRDPVLGLGSQLTSVVGSANEALYPGGMTSLPGLLSSSPSHSSLLEAADSPYNVAMVTEPGQGQVSGTPTLRDKHFEELRPVQHKHFPGQHAPRTAFDVLHNPAFFRNDPYCSGQSPPRLRDTAPKVFAPRSVSLRDRDTPSRDVTPTSSPAHFSGQQDGVSSPFSTALPTRGDPPLVQQYPCVSEMGATSSWYGRCPADCYTLPSSSQPYPSASYPGVSYPNVYKQSCNHSINITLTYK